MSDKREIDVRCGWCDRELDDFPGSCDCTRRHKMDAEDVRVGMALMAAEFCDHFCCDLPPMICRAKRLRQELERER